ncbi:hypothetical protein [Streptomyces pinistramenti]|uniref:hypothetical protein n=1 Tax=Streptomyces pinistramenti TaxID=2884812 RepID=UPI001D066B4A|nr:hypothetical protein [Streptomyces pinistramenti]MCB5910451.1 hypothetical protein [Streptomyces pinistramenti]
MTPPPRPPLRLYLFPHAGATSLLYRPWQPLAPTASTCTASTPPAAAPAPAKPP